MSKLTPKYIVNQVFRINWPIRQKSAILLLAGALSVSGIYAQEDTTSHNLTEVVVTGQFKPQSLKNSVYNVRVVNNERIKYSGANNLQQVLMNQLGFRFSNDNTLGTSDVFLMGMAGRNVKILLDGVPLIDRGDTRESLSQIDINTIEKVEIVEGPMSVAYGSDALAGVVNIITKKPVVNLLSVTAKAQEETAGSEYYPFSYKGVHTQNLGVSWSNNKWSVAVNGSHIDFDGFGGDTYGRGKSWRPKEQWLGNVRVGYNYGGKNNIYYRLDGLNEEISYRYPMNLNTFRAVDQMYTTNRLMHQLQNQWHINNKMHLATIFAYTDYSRKTKTLIHDFREGTTELGTAAGQQDISNFTSIAFRNTFSYQLNDKISLQPGLDINHEKASGQRIKNTPEINDYAFFVSSEIKFTPAINIRPGLRFIKNSVYDAPPVIPSINTKFALNKRLDLRASYAYGFRSPALRELYFNFIDANHVIIGNPDLKAEYSNSFLTSFVWQPAFLNSVWKSATLSGFYNTFHNLINYATSPTSSDTTITVNIDRFKTTGGTFENQFAWKNLSFTLGFSYIGRYNSLSDDDTYKDGLPKFNWTPEINTNILYTVKPTKTTIGFFYKYQGDRPGYQLYMNPLTAQQEVMETNVAGFHWADLTVTQPFFKYLTVSAGIKNLFDVTNLDNTATTGNGAHSTGGPVPMSFGRSYFLGLAFNWNKK